ncbi:nuclear transport factor 2 family protein [Vibrio sp. S4M6]|uniref:nuclear transport factor 2 family protein n=1 Tax=Vibrio sinus TaxID=2946865 RepID=UPI002029C2FA|nr:nuclear transport factor 2 family protein [Vibrio sinus]MCL9779947.1 nuclear transport factor 2 family protein [Vibrio sinus]
MKNVELVKQYREYFKQKEIPAALGLVADDAIWNTDNAGGSWSGVHKGKEAILQHLKNIGKECQLIAWHTHSIFPYNNIQVIEVAYLKFKFLATGEVYESDVVCFFDIEDEKITRYKVYEDEQKLVACYQRVLDAQKHNLSN